MITATERKHIYSNRGDRTSTANSKLFTVWLWRKVKHVKKLFINLKKIIKTVIKTITLVMGSFAEDRKSGLAEFVQLALLCLSHYGWRDHVRSGCGQK